MKIEQHKSLYHLNTLGFDQKAEYFCEPQNIDELREALEFARQKSLSVFTLGAGSNIVLVGDIAGLTIKYAGNSLHQQTSGSRSLVTAEAGFNWHELVQHTVNQGLYGIENLSLIPGNVGAAPIQNIGAYGVELGDVLTELSAVDIKTGELMTLGRDDCELGYRDSIFKNDLRGRTVITKVTLDLSTIKNVSTEYKALADEFSVRASASPTARDISDAVTAIRMRKLPDPRKIGNVGSFFKNPVVNIAKYQLLSAAWPEIPVHRIDEIDGGHFKVPAAWLIDTAGWKGYRNVDVGVHPLQALVLVNYGGATGAELLALSNTIRQSVADTFDIALEQEPVTVGSPNQKRRVNSAAR